MTIAPSYPATFAPLDLPATRSDDSGTLPLALQYTGDASLETAKEHIRQLSIKQLLAAGRGALLIRGLPIETPAEISEAVRAFGIGREYRQVGIAGTRTYVGKELQTANEGPPTLRLYVSGFGRCLSIAFSTMNGLDSRVSLARSSLPAIPSPRKKVEKRP